MSIMINPPAGPWTVDDLVGVEDAGFRVEIHEGSLVMMSPVTLWHSRVARRIFAVLTAQGRPAETEIGVKRSARSTRIADVAVFTKAPSDLHQAFWSPEELELVVEVVSDSSVEEDRTAKPRWYAAAGIPAYWRVEEHAEDPSDAVIFQFERATTADGESVYVQTGVTTLAALEAAA